MISLTVDVVNDSPTEGTGCMWNGQSWADNHRNCAALRLGW